MKYLTNFKTKEEYEAFKASGEYLTPNVSFIETAGSVINDSYQIPGGSASSVEYLDVTELDEDMRFSLINSCSLVKWVDYSGVVYIYPAIFAKNEAYDFYNEVMAIAIDFSSMVSITIDSFGSIKELISCDNGYSLEMLDSLPRITEEEFYNLDIVQVIEFTINGTPYKAEKGMTWQEFVESSYNDGRISVYYNYVNHDGISLANTSSGMSAPQDVIVPNYNYEYAAV